MNGIIKFLTKGVFPIAVAVALTVVEGARFIDDHMSEKEETEETKDTNNETEKVEEKDVKVETEDGKEAK